MQFIVNLSIYLWEEWKACLGPCELPLMKHRPEFRNQQREQQQRQEQQQEQQQGGEHLPLEVTAGGVRQ